MRSKRRVGERRQDTHTTGYMSVNTEPQHRPLARVSSSPLCAARTGRFKAHQRRCFVHGHSLAFTRYSFTSRLSCTNQPSFHPPRLPALPTPVQYDCTIIGQYTTPLLSYRLYAIHHTILVITISCKGQVTADATADFTEGNSRASGGSGLLCSHSQTIHNTKGTHAHTQRELI